MSPHWRLKPLLFWEKFEYFTTHYLFINNKFCIYFYVDRVKPSSNILLIVSVSTKTAPVLTNAVIHLFCLFASQQTMPHQPNDDITCALSHILHVFFIHWTFTSLLFTRSNTETCFFLHLLSKYVHILEGLRVKLKPAYFHTLHLPKIVYVGLMLCKSG